MNTLWLCTLLGLVVVTVARPNWKHGLKDAVAKVISEDGGEGEDIINSFDLIVDLDKTETHDLNKFIHGLFKEAEKEMKEELKDGTDVEETAEQIVDDIEAYLLAKGFIAPPGAAKKACKYGCS